jgi:hypothetical protein
MPEVLLAAVPLILLVGSLLLGRYPGHRAIVRLSEHIAARRRRRTPKPARARRPAPPRRFAPSGGLLLACGIASRPPPLSL